VQAGSVIAGRYRLERPLAKGGMGSVWVARHLHLDTVVAVKFMAPEFAASADARLRFEREAKASAQIKSPHVVHVYDFGLEGDTPFLAMELLEGEDLGSRLKVAGRLSLHATSKILSQISKGLRRAHEARIVHRDLKPGNIFLQRQDDDEIVKILDFGLAKILGPPRVGEETKTGLVMGSMRYMSPEQLQSSKKVDHRSDLWALGVILYRCLTGKVPFDAEEMADVVIQILRDPIPAPSVIVPELTSDIDDFFKRALDRDRERRFQSASELAEAFAALSGYRLSGERPSFEWTEAARALSLGSRQPRAEVEPRAKVTLSDLPTTRREAPPRLDPTPNPKILSSDIPTAILPSSALHPTSPPDFAHNPRTTSDAVSLEGTLTPQSDTPRPESRESRGRSILKAGAAVCFVAAVIAVVALIGRPWGETNEAASTETPPAKANAALPVAVPATSTSSLEIVPAVSERPPPEAIPAATVSATPSAKVSSSLKPPPSPSSTVRALPAKPVEDPTLGF
jgi:serine/threonine-protein kinase